ncbi:DUF3098 domain-containing protein [Membranicola marinus]|uniref:DUF3098 domain-containing protein n=1 Tax=Membranihabitans marinus TaxID=1227546 RepID=A0A953HZU5_9BACT|nr:DUF3098 domain-containing protein [Membranihabitans marinus]MBY5959761.1 DUF3098 domain-containing protein [Membranihabitans marinus]
MAAQRKKKVIKSTAPRKRKAPVRRKESVTKSNAFTHYSDFLFSNENYMFVGGGFLLIVVGMFLMSGGHMPDDETWDPNIIYSFRRVTLAPIVILIGLALPILGIFRK